MNRAALPASLALAFALCAPARADNRLVTHFYRADEVVRIDGRVGVQGTIAFGEDERIENVAIGDSASWQVTPNRRANLLFVKPLSPRARTNMTVVTDRRTYVFDLIAGASANPVYVLRFAYPEEPKPAAAPAMGADALNEDEARLAEGERPVDPAQLNFAWTRRGDGRLMPAQVFDDGSQTYIKWSAKAPLPAILVRNEKGEEGPVNFAVRDDTVVIEGVPALIVLRAGRASAQLENRAAARGVGQLAASAAHDEPKEE